MKQDYSKYTDVDHQVWQILFERQLKILAKRASDEYLTALEIVEFKPDRIPNFQRINEILAGTSGWEVVGVPGLMEPKAFFDLLAVKQFPATTWIRKMEQLDYLEEPDMFHDVFGHVPLLCHKQFTEFLFDLGKLAQEDRGPEWIDLLEAVYWYTVEFGLIQQENGLRIYGAGIISSPKESVFSLGDEPVRFPFDVEKMARTPFRKDAIQDKYFVLGSMEELFESVAKIGSLVKV